MRQDEHNLQVACVRWFNLQYPQYRGLLFACPNGGNRNLVTAAKLKAEGVTPGVADLLLLVPRAFKANDNDEWYIIFGLCIEMKTAKGRQSPEQKVWQKKVEGEGYRYRVCHSIEEFMETINGYLK